MKNFQDWEASLITSVRLCGSQHRDILVWPRERDGIFFYKEWLFGRRGEASCWLER